MAGFGQGRGHLHPTTAWARRAAQAPCQGPSAPATTTAFQRRQSAAEAVLASTLAPCFPAISRCQHRTGVPVRVSRALRSLLGEQGRAEGLFPEGTSWTGQLPACDRGTRSRSRVRPLPYKQHGVGISCLVCKAPGWDSGGTGEGLPPSQPCHPSDTLREPLALRPSGRAELPALITLVSGVVLLGGAGSAPPKGGRRSFVPGHHPRAPQLSPCPAWGSPPASLTHPAALPLRFGFSLNVSFNKVLRK